MWISRKELRRKNLAEYQLGLKLGIGIGRNQILVKLAARVRKGSREPHRCATVETPVVATSSKEYPGHV